MAARLRAGVIGCGVGGYHAYAYQQHPDVDVVAICDLNPAIFARLYERSGVPAGSVHEYTDHREMLQREQLDMVSVAVPDQFHSEPVIDAAAAGVAGIICEKPLTTTLVDADRMVEAVQKHGTKMLVDHTRCFDPAYIEVRDRIREGYIGELTRVVAYIGGKRAMLFRNTTHLLGALMFFVESSPEWVIAALDHGFEQYGLVYNGQGGKNPAFDPGATMITGFANGVRALIMGSKGTASMGVQLDLIGTQGRIIVGDRETHAWQSKESEGTLEPREVTWRQGIDSSLGVRLVPAVDQLIHMIRDGAPGNSSPEAARDVLELMLGALKSQAEGMVPVRLPLPR